MAPKDKKYLQSWKIFLTVLSCELVPVVGDNKSWRKQQLLVKRQRRSIVGDTAGREAELRTLHLKVWKTRYSNLGMIYFQRDGGLVCLCQMVGLCSMCNHSCSAAPNICCSKSKVGSKFQNLKTQIGKHLLHVMLTLRFLASGRRSRLHNAVL